MSVSIIPLMRFDDRMTEPGDDERTPRRRVLVTGAAGRIGTAFVLAARDRYDLDLLDLPGAFRAEHEASGRIVETDIADLERLVEAFAGVDTVVHLAGERRPGAAWSTLLPANIVGTYNVVAAALAAGCRRVVYASSVHAVSGYGTERRIRESDPPLPASLYGATKCWGEALGASASAEGLSFVSLRVGAFEDPDVLDDEGAGWMLRDYCAPDDLMRMLQLAIDAEGIGFEIFHAVSSNTLGRLSTAKTEDVLGFSGPDVVSLVPRLRGVGELLATRRTYESGFRDDVSAVGRRARG